MKLVEATVLRILNNGRVLVSSERKRVMASNPQAIPLSADMGVYINADRAIVNLVTKKVDIWKRCTEEEVEIIQETINGMPLKAQLTFRDIDEINHLEDFYLEIKSSFSTVLGEDRALELLARS